MAGAVFFGVPATAQGADKPNIVLILMDNYGWGEPGVYGGGVLRGAPSPNTVTSFAFYRRICEKRIRAAQPLDDL